MIAHVGGVPLEEILPVVPSAGAGLLLARAWLMLRLRRRREPERVTMAPEGYLFDGRATVAPLIEHAHCGVDRERRLVPTAANSQPAAASYLHAPRDDTFRAFTLDVLRIADGKIAELTTFGGDPFDRFGLPPTLPD